MSPLGQRQSPTTSSGQFTPIVAPPQSQGRIGSPTRHWTSGSPKSGNSPAELTSNLVPRPTVSSRPAFQVHHSDSYHIIKQKPDQIRNEAVDSGSDVRTSGPKGPMPGSDNGSFLISTIEMKLQASLARENSPSAFVTTTQRGDNNIGKIAVKSPIENQPSNVPHESYARATDEGIKNKIRNPTPTQVLMPQNECGQEAPSANIVTYYSSSSQPLQQPQQQTHQQQLQPPPPQPPPPQLPKKSHVNHGSIQYEKSGVTCHYDVQSPKVPPSSSSSSRGDLVSQQQIVAPLSNTIGQSLDNSQAVQQQQQQPPQHHARVVGQQFQGSMNHPSPAALLPVMPVVESIKEPRIDDTSNSMHPAGKSSLYYVLFGHFDSFIQRFQLGFYSWTGDH